jgi:hypothetical protein
MRTGGRGVPPQHLLPLYQRRSIDCCSAWRAVSLDWGVAGSGLGCGFGLSFMVLTFVESGAPVVPVALGRTGITGRPYA